MTVFTLDREQEIARPIATVFDFFSQAANLQEITPPWLDFRITQQPARLECGSHLHYRLRWHGVPLSWETEITAWNPPHSFEDRQLRGPYALWHHRHSFVETAGGVRMTDHVDYALPLGRLGVLTHALMVRRDVARIFDYRYTRIAAIFGACNG